MLLSASLATMIMLLDIATVKDDWRKPMWKPVMGPTAAWVCGTAIQTRDPIIRVMSVRVRSLVFIYSISE